MHLMSSDCQDEVTNLFEQVQNPEELAKYEENHITWPSFSELRSELWRQACLGAPITVLNLIGIGRFGVCTGFLGYLGGLELEGGTLALTFANLTGYMVLLGLSGAMEALSSQAFGAQRPDFMLSMLCKGILMFLLASIPVGLSWLGCYSFLLYFGHKASVAAVSQRYMHFLLPDLLLQAVIAPITVSLRCQQKFRLLLIVSGVGFLLQVVISSFLVVGLTFGAAGTALAMCLADLVVLVMLLASFFKEFNSFRTSNAACLIRTSWGSLLCNLALPSCMMIGSEWWCYQIMVVFSALVKHPNRSTLATLVALNSDPLLYTFQLALSSCACIRTGNELGRNSPASAHNSAVASFLASMVLGVMSFAWIVSGRNLWGNLFTSDTEATEEVARLLPVMGLVELFSFPVLVSGGILRGSGRAMPGAAASVGSLYAVGLPVSLVAGVVLELGVLGLWMGLLLGVMCCSATSILAALSVDWSRCEKIFKEDHECHREEEELELFNQSDEESEVL